MLRKRGIIPIGMTQQSSRLGSGFTLVEIMIVASVIALLAAITMPGFLRARKRSQATRILEDLRLFDQAVDQYAVETNKPSGMHPVFNDLKPYVKANTRLYLTGRDLFNRRYGPFTVDNYPRVPTRSFNALSASPMRHSGPLLTFSLTP